MAGKYFFISFSWSRLGYIVRFGLWCLTPCSTIFQLYRGDQFYCWKKPEYSQKTTDLSLVTTKLYHIMWYRAQALMAYVVVNPTTIRSRPRRSRYIVRNAVLSIQINIWMLQGNGQFDQIRFVYRDVLLLIKIIMSLYKLTCFIKQSCLIF